MTTLSVAGDSDHVPNVATGEWLEVATSSTEDLAAARAALTELELQRREALGKIDAEIIARADRAVRSGELEQHTFTVGDYRLEVDSPAKSRVNAGELRQHLLAQARELDLSPEAIEGAFRVTYAVAASRFKTLARQVPELDSLKERYSEPQRRYVKVTRFRPARSSTPQLHP